MTTILIIGASRGIGLETVKLALQAGYTVRALSRSAQKIDFAHPNLSKISASATDISAVEEAVEGSEAVITTLGIPPTFQPVYVFSDSMAVLIPAMEKHGVKRLIAVTGFGAGDSKGVGGLLYSKLLQPIFLGTIYDDKTREEELIKKSDLDWTIARPGVLTRLPPKGTYKILVERKTWKGGFISRLDVADFLIKQIEDRTYIHKTPILIS